MRVAPQFDLLVAGDRLHGWFLGEPERFLVSGWEHSAADIPAPGLAALLKEYFDLVADPAIERIEDQHASYAAWERAYDSEGCSWCVWDC